MRYNAAVSEASDTDLHGGPPKREPDFVLRSNTFAFPLSAIVLVATVAAVYYFTPVRKGVLFARAAAEHRSSDAPDLAEPSPDQLAAWSIGALGPDVPWPVEGDAVPVGARSIEIQRLRAGIVRYRVADAEVSLVAQRARDAPPRRRRLADEGDTILSWRAGKWTMVAVGPSANVAAWARPLGAPDKLVK